MTNNLPARANRLRLVHEALFSLNIGLAVRWAMAEANYSALTLQFWINRHLRLHPHSSVGGDAAFLLLALGITLCVFLLLRAFSSTFFVRRLLHSIAGILSVAALPFVWLYSARVHEPLPGFPNPPSAWLLIQL